MKNTGFFSLFACRFWTGAFTNRCLPYCFLQCFLKASVTTYQKQEVLAEKCPPPGKPVTFYECHPDDHAPAPSVRADFSIQLRMVSTVSKVISVLEKSKLWSLALWVMFMMTDQKVTPDTITHNAAISRGPQVLKTTHHLGRIWKNLRDGKHNHLWTFVNTACTTIPPAPACTTQLSVPAAPNAAPRCLWITLAAQFGLA